jgi:PGF-CTERM protein
MSDRCSESHDTVPNEWTRRSVLAATATAGAGAATGVAGAQSEETEITTSLVIPADTSKLGNDDFTGLLIQVVDQGKTDASDTDVASCDSIEDDRIISYQLALTDERDDSEETVEATGFASRSNDNVRPDQEFIVSNQDECGDGYLDLSLEEVTRSGIEVDTESTSTAASTSTSVPGFSVATAVAGVTAAAAGAVWRSVHS